MSKTLLISEIFPPKHGGSGRWFWELYSRLPSNEYIIAAGDNDPSGEFDKTHNLNLQRLDLFSPSWGIKSSSGLAFYWRTFWQLRKIIKQEKIQQIHCGRCLPEGVMGYLLSIFTGIPFLCYVHGEDVETASTSRELSWLVKKVLSKATTLISNSKNTANILINAWDAQSEKVIVLNPGCDTNKFIPAEFNPDVRNNLGWGNRKVILTVGRLQKRKGHDMMISALPTIKEHHPEILYAIVGDGDEKQSLKDLVNTLSLQNNVVFHDEISDEQMVQCYQQCDLFILPNRTVGNDIEGFGMVLVEAQSSGKPVLAGDSGGTAETMILEKSGNIIDCTEPAHISAEIIRLLSDDVDLHAMGVIARNHAKETLDWVEHKNKAVKIFSNVK